MRNAIKCNNCNTENPVYKLNCMSCNSIMRNRVVNLEIWSTFWGLLESPVKTFVKIIQSEHKNFIVFLTIAACIKYFLSSTILINAFYQQKNAFSGNYLVQFALVSVVWIVIILLLSLLLKVVFRTLKVYTRFKDNYSILVFAHLPQLLIFPVLFVVEFAVFGNYWITFNPPPFVIKPAVSYALIGIEGLLVLLTFWLMFSAIYSQSRLKVFSVLLGFIVKVIIYAVIILFSLLFFI